MLLTLLDPVGGSVGLLPRLDLEQKKLSLVSDRLLAELIRVAWTDTCLRRSHAASTSPTSDVTIVCPESEDSGGYPSGQRGLAVNQVLQLRRFKSCSPHQAFEKTLAE